LRLLAIDTTLAACQAAVLSGGEVLAVRSEPMPRGHQERLAPLVAETMQAAGLGFEQLDRIAVTVGPGSFTGLRVGLAFAKGLALARAIPCVGVGTLEALAASAGGDGRIAVLVDGGRDQAYLQLFDRGAAVGPPEALDWEATRRRLMAFKPSRMIGPGAERVGAPADVHTLMAPDPVAVGRLAVPAREPLAPPRPLYLRAPDARLPA
jgi:tRNA threonylcarbamoyladenosine biosynthesis protein TsaB